MKTANFVMPTGAAQHEADVTVDIRRKTRAAVGQGPVGDAAVGPQGVVVVTNAGARSVSVLDTATGRTTATVAVDGDPFAVATSDGRAYVSVASDAHDAVWVIDLLTHAVIGTYPLAFSVSALTVSPDGKRVYAGRIADDHVDVAVIDITAERVGTIDIARGAGLGIDAVRVDASGKRLYVAVTDPRGSRLVVVDTETARTVRTVTVGAPIRDLALADGTAYVLTSDRSRGGVLCVVDVAAGRVTETLALGGAPTQMGLSADGTLAYVVDYDEVAVISTLSLKVIDTVDVDARPASAVADADGLCVADYAGRVTTFTVESTIPMFYAQFLATDPIVVPVLRELVPATA